MYSAYAHSAAQTGPDPYKLFTRLTYIRRTSTAHSSTQTLQQSKRQKIALSQQRSPATQLRPGRSPKPNRKRTYSYVLVRSISKPAKIPSKAPSRPPSYNKTASCPPKAASFTPPPTPAVPVDGEDSHESCLTMGQALEILAAE
jgi:hypothetical protein